MKTPFLLAAMAGATALAPISGACQPNPMVADRERQATPAPSVGSASPTAPKAPLVPGAPSVALTRVVIEGHTTRGAALEAAWRPFAGRHLDGANIRAVADAVSHAYEASGLALYTVQVPEQDFGGGVLRLRVVEGFIEETVIHGQTKADLSLLRVYAKRLSAERPLTRRTLERYISLIRDIPGLTPDIQLLQGSAPGGVKLGVGVAQKRSDLTYTLNTNGQPLIGREQLQVDWTLNSLLRQGDQTRLTAAASTDFDQMRYISVSHSQPLGADGLRANVSAGWLRTRPDSIPIQGHAALASIGLSYPVLRGYQRNLYVTGTLDGLDSDSAVFGQTLANEHVRAARAGATYSKNAPKTSYALSATASQGIDGLGAQVDARLADIDFTKLALRAGYDHKLGKTVTLRLRGTAQITDDALPTSEQIGLGGPEFGRGFATSLLLGDRGQAASAELGWAPPGAKAGPVGLGEVYIFADAGEVKRNARPILPEAKDHLSSAGGGVRVALGKKLNVGVEAAHPIDAPAGVRDDRWRFGFSLGSTY